MGLAHEDGRGVSWVRKSTEFLYVRSTMYCCVLVEKKRVSSLPFFLLLKNWVREGIILRHKFPVMSFKYLRTRVLRALKAGYRQHTEWRSKIRDVWFWNGMSEIFTCFRWSSDPIYCSISYVLRQYVKSSLSYCQPFLSLVLKRPARTRGTHHHRRVLRARRSSHRVRGLQAGHDPVERVCLVPARLVPLGLVRRRRHEGIRGGRVHAQLHHQADDGGERKN